MFARLLPLIVTASAAPDGDGRCSEALAAEDQSLAFVQLELSRAPKEAAQTNWYPGRAVDSNRSGSSKAIGPFPLSAPAWQFEVPGLNFHQTPCIDDMLNVYTGSDAGLVFSFDKFGVKRWEVRAGKRSCQNPFLLQGILYTSCGDGEAIAYEMDTGKEIWRTKVSDSLPGDTYSMGATDDYLFMPAGAIEGHNCGSPEVVLLNRADGSVRWRYSVLLKHGTGTINMAGCHFDDSVVFSDVNGGVYRLSVKDGSEIWYQPGGSPSASTLGGVSCGPNGKVYNSYAADGKGGMQALDINTGRRLWVKNYPDEVHNAPAVGKIYGYDKPAVIFGMGKPTRKQSDPTSVNGTVFAADAETGETIWTFEPQIWQGTECAGFTESQRCSPDLFSGATIGSDGTVYINWSAGGITYALRELNGDGRCDLEDTMEVSGYDIASAATGPPAIAPGMLFVNTCRRLAAFIE